MPDHTFVLGTDLFESWRGGIENGDPSLLWSVGPGFDHVEVGPGRILLLGGAPGVGKSALVMQWLFNALTGHPDLRAVVASVEMSPSTLLDRQLARLSGIPLTRIRERQFEHDDQGKLAQGFNQVNSVLDRLAFVTSPNQLDRIRDAADDHKADLIVLDYLQRIEPPGRFNGMRERINALMSIMRDFAGPEVGILAAAALTRSRDAQGRSSYDHKHLSLASFRESSELEYGADDCFLLFPADSDTNHSNSDRHMTLSHQKSRYGETQDVDLTFHRRVQAFEPLDPETMPVKGSSGSTAARVRSIWVDSSCNGKAKGKSRP
jgi:replicative DNA helicase